MTSSSRRPPRSSVEIPPPAIMLYDWKTIVYHPWKNGNPGLIIELDPKSEGAIVLADGNVGWVSQVIIEVLDESR